MRECGANLTSLGGKAGPQASSSKDRSSALVRNLVNVESNVTSEKMDVDQIITLPFKRTSKTKSCCLICHAKCKLCVVPLEARLRIFINRGIIIQGKQKLCKKHFKGKVIKENEESRVPTVSNTTTLTSLEISALLDDFRCFAKKRSLNFDIPGAMSDSNYVRLTGMTA